MKNRSIPRLKELYKEKIVPEMMKRYNYENSFQVPKIEKIVINIGISEGKENIKALDTASAELAAITGQKPMLCRAKKAISNFKLRENAPIGLKVTLRGDRMYEFLDRLISCSIPKTRDLRGLEVKGFDSRGNYNLGLTEQYIFPEVDLDKSDKPRGMNISFVINTESGVESKDLMTFLGMPFKKR